MLEEIKETPVEVLNVKPYTLRKLKATEFFPTLNILKKIGLNKFTSILQTATVKGVMEKVKTGETDEIADDGLIGFGSVVFEIAQVVLDGIVHCEDDIYTLLSNVSGLSIDDIKDFDMDVFLEMIIDLIKQNVDFIKVVSKYLTN